MSTYHEEINLLHEEMWNLMQEVKQLKEDKMNMEAALAQYKKSVDVPVDPTEYIVNNFDFEKVKKVMHALEWKWVAEETGHTIIPDISRMMRTARRLLNSAISQLDSHKEYTVASGGFYATANKNEDDESKPYLSLKFCVADFDNYD